MTNLERIKSLDGYDMARLLDDFNANGACKYCIYECCYSDECLSHSVDCASGLYKWLMQETKE